MCIFVCGVHHLSRNCPAFSITKQIVEETLGGAAQPNPNRRFAEAPHSQSCAPRLSNVHRRAGGHLCGHLDCSAENDEYVDLGVAVQTSKKHVSAKTLHVNFTSSRFCRFTWTPCWHLGGRLGRRRAGAHCRRVEPWHRRRNWSSGTLHLIWPV